MTGRVVRSDPTRFKASQWRTAKQWAKWEKVGLEPTLDLDDLVLNWTDGRVKDLQARGAITGVELTRTIEGASTLTITLRDPDSKLFSEWAKRMRAPSRSRRGRRTPVEADEGWDPIISPDLRGRAMQVNLDGAVFRLVQAGYQHQTQEITLTFEDRIVYLLKRKRGERRASRAKVTRAQFILSLLREVKLIRPPFICPDLTVKQPIDKPDANGTTPLTRSSTRALRAATNGSAASGAAAGADAGAGISTTTELTVKGKPATSEQLRVGQQVLDASSEAKADPRPTKAAVCACIVESEMQNLRGGDRDSRGVLQIRDATARGMGVDNTNVSESVTAFHKRGFWGKGGAIDVARKNPGMSVGHVAQNTQGSAHPERYDQVADEAQKWIDAYSGGALGAGDGEYVKSYQFAREPDENSWTAIQRLAEEVGWRCFIVGEAVYYMAEDALYRRRPRYEINRRNLDAIVDLSYDIDWGKTVSEATLVVSLDRWGAPPGAVILLDGLGPPDGRWLITQVRRDWFAPTAEITIKQPGRAKREPAAERGQRAAAANGYGLTPGSGSASERVYAEAAAISDKGYPYVWGGGHAKCGTPDGGTGRDPGTGFDCSGYVCACLAAGGLGFKPGERAATSGELAASWGEPGEGDKLTVWANNQHTFLELKGLGRGRYADTGRNASPPNERGARLRSGERSTDGFTARRWPGV